MLIPNVKDLPGVVGSLSLGRAHTCLDSRGWHGVLLCASCGVVWGWIDIYQDRVAANISTSIFGISLNPFSVSYLQYTTLICVHSLTLIYFPLFVKAADEYKIVSTPPFAESVTEGDVKWNKG